MTTTTTNDQNEPLVADTAKIRKWERTLKVHELTIESLFELSRPSQLLLEKLNTVQKLLADMPNATMSTKETEAIFNEWNTRLAGWWKRYACYGNPIRRSRSLMDTLSNSEISESIADGPFHTSYFTAQKLPGISEIGSEKTILIQKTKSAIRAQMKLEFEKMPNIEEKKPDTAEETEGEAAVEDEATRDSLTALLNLVERSRALTIPFWKDNRLQMDIFDFAFAKLPLSHQLRYHAVVDPSTRKKSLRDLRRYLLLELSLEAEVREWIEREFTILTLETTGNEQNDLKKLLRLLNRASNQMFAFDCYTNDAIFDTAFSRLSDEKRVLFNDNYAGSTKKSLRNLRKFLEDSITSARLQIAPRPAPALTKSASYSHQKNESNDQQNVIEKACQTSSFVALF